MRNGMEHGTEYGMTLHVHIRLLSQQNAHGTDRKAKRCLILLLYLLMKILMKILISLDSISLRVNNGTNNMDCTTFRVPTDVYNQLNAISTCRDYLSGVLGLSL